MTNATNALGKRLVPEDAAAGERFCVWIGDWLYEVTKNHGGRHDYTIQTTERGRKRKAAA